MLITQEFMNRLTPVEVAFIRAEIHKLCQDKIKHETTNYENLETRVEMPALWFRSFCKERIQSAPQTEIQV